MRSATTTSGQPKTTSGQPKTKENNVSVEDKPMIDAEKLLEEWYAFKEIIF